MPAAKKMPLHYICAQMICAQMSRCKTSPFPCSWTYCFAVPPPARQRPQRDCVFLFIPALPQLRSRTHLLGALGRLHQLALHKHTGAGAGDVLQAAERVRGVHHLLLHQHLHGVFTHACNCLITEVRESSELRLLNTVLASTSTCACELVWADHLRQAASLELVMLFLLPSWRLAGKPSAPPPLHQHVEAAHMASSPPFRQRNAEAVQGIRLVHAQRQLPGAAILPGGWGRWSHR